MTTRKATKSIISALLIAIMMLTLTACGVDMKKMSGTWVLDTIDGKSVADYTAALGLPEVAGMKIAIITENDCTIQFLDAEGQVASDKGTNTVRSNGIDVKFTETEGSFFQKDSTVGIVYDEKADTISFKVSDTETEMAFVFKKGSYDLKAKYDEFVAEYTAAMENAEAEAIGEYEEYDEGEYEEYEDYEE